jgi:hypothetical protein
MSSYKIPADLSDPTKMEETELVVDGQLLELYDSVHDFFNSREVIGLTEEEVKVFCRAAWAKGATQALQRPKLLRKVFRSLGYRPPTNQEE